MSKRDKILSALGLNVRKNRESRELTQEKLAEKSGLDPTYISDIVRGLRNPGIKNVAKLAKALAGSDHGGTLSRSGRVRGKTKSPRSSRRKEAQIKTGKSQSLKEDAPPYRAGAPSIARQENAHRAEQCSALQPRFIDLFCGIGGFRLAGRSMRLLLRLERADPILF